MEDGIINYYSLQQFPVHRWQHCNIWWRTALSTPTLTCINFQYMAVDTATSDGGWHYQLLLSLASISSTWLTTLQHLVEDGIINTYSFLITKGLFKDHNYVKEVQKISRLFIFIHTEWIPDQSIDSISFSLSFPSLTVCFTLPKSCLANLIPSRFSSVVQRSVWHLLNNSLFGFLEWYNVAFDSSRTKHSNLEFCQRNWYLRDLTKAPDDDHTSGGRAIGLCMPQAEVSELKLSSTTTKIPVTPIIMSLEWASV